MTNASLWNSKKGKNYIIKSVLLEDILSRRLQALGINEGTVLSIVTKKRSGAMVVRVRGTRLALGRHISEHIEVKETEEDGKA